MYENLTSACLLYCVCTCVRVLCTYTTQHNTTQHNTHTHTGGPPLGYFDWSMLSQLVWNGIESALLFGAAAATIDWCMEKGIISKFPG